jgi:23S rRNA pseudouridine1911/1915/1917 synthase
MNQPPCRTSDLIISTPPQSDDVFEEPDEPVETEWRSLVVTTQAHGLRLDRALADAVSEFSRSYLQQLIEAGAVEVDARSCLKPSTKVRAGQSLRIELRPTPQSQAFKPEAMRIDVVYSDEHLLVINKPPGLVVHPAPGNWSGTLLNGLLAMDAQAASLPRAGIVHRLDKDTSGLMVVARTRSTMDALVRMIALREVGRQYLALAHRPWSGPRQRDIDAPIGRDPRQRLRMAVVDLERQAGKSAHTGVELLQNAAAGCWVRCTLQTGRTHQIRVHLAHIGHALVSDALYEGRPACGMNRQALHAYRLAFSHPVSGESLVFRAPLPADMQGALAAWGLSYNEAAW